MECFGTGDAPVVVRDRWRVLVTSGCRAGREFDKAWATLHWLGGSPAEHPLLVVVNEVGAGMAQTDGQSLRGALQQQVEQLRARALLKALSVHPDRTARPVIS